MRWTIARDKDLPALQTLLHRREWGCVAFSERLLRAGHARIPPRIREKVLFYRNGSNEVAGALLHSTSGTVLPCLPSCDRMDAQLAGRLADRLRRSTLSMVMGPAAQVRFLESLVSERPKHTVDYLLMARESAVPLQMPTEGWYTIRCADETDTQQLAPLQLGYEAEEVLLPGRSLNAALTLRNLRRRLRTQQTFVAECAGRLIGMAGTNARGFLYDQIGGVYTVAEQRNRGVSRALMAHITHCAAAERKRLCLFVKKTNSAAIHIYASSEFLVRGGFRISYYGQ